ncbi:hypothetical protein AVEN_31721-1 [Araneus ventricosus]|uniref:Uncharacterized protein n=1 Tax=Araneus ventricosus TaxID=182803 RepID=A0A4Y2VLA6_ARAVE|nr:hypothetical protein AVEN_31721-1 [Araneus ventricosus]
MGSVFLGRATAQDLLDSFLKALSNIPLSKIFLVSMDGLNVNLSFLNKFEEHISNEYPDSKHLIKMGTCGLHVIHGAMKTDQKSVDWDIFAILRNLYYLFKDSSARRADFTRITSCSIFPKKNCAVRWLENSDCIARAIKIVDPVTKYLSQLKHTDCKLKASLQMSMKDPFIKCKLAFIMSLSLQCEIFLTNFQSEKVCVPNLYAELPRLLGGIIKKFVKPEKVLEGSALLKLDLNSKDNLLEAKNLNVGFGAKKYFKKLKIADKTKFFFFWTVTKFCRIWLKKLLLRVHSNINLVRGLSSLHPSVMLNNSSIGLTRFNIVLEVLHNANRITEIVAERAKDQYVSFCSVVKERH